MHCIQSPDAWHAHVVVHGGGMAEPLADPMEASPRQEDHGKFRLCFREATKG
jgi:hypothetical protein